MLESASSLKTAIGRLRKPGLVMPVLEKLRNSNLKNRLLVKNYADALLYLCASAPGEKIYELVEEEIIHLSELLEAKSGNTSWQYSLAGTGLPFTEMRGQYSATLAKWLLKKFPANVRPEKANRSSEEFQQLCLALLPGIEFFQSGNEDDHFWKRIKTISGAASNTLAIEWLLEFLDNTGLSPELSDQLFDHLEIFLCWKITGERFNRLTLRAPKLSRNFQKQKKILLIDPLRYIGQPIPKHFSMKLEEKTDWIETARASLALYYRETDPFTFADPAETFVFQLDKNFSILLTGMEKKRRLSLESYIGFMVFRNRVPVAYGGGWIFGFRCRIGINIYPPFRGLSSRELFCQVLRLYSKRFNIRQFIIKPYQFGKGNSEGLKSGAFWFYYKIGFRPEDKKILRIAEIEWKKIESNNRYRVPIDVLKTFTRSRLKWDIAKGASNIAEGEVISQAVTNMIVQQFRGNRKKAIADAFQFAKFPNTIMQDITRLKYFQNWALILFANPGARLWNEKQMRQFRDLTFKKTVAEELDYIRAIQTNADLWASFNQIETTSPTALFTVKD